MKALFIINGMVKSAGVVSVSGGDMRLLEIVRNNPNVDAHILTTPNGREFLKKYNEDRHKTYLLNHELTGGLVDNLVISLKSFFLGKTGATEFKNGVVYSSCEHLYDVLPALRLKWQNKCKWYAVYHWVEDYPWREMRGNTPFVSRYAYWLNRWFSGMLIKHFSDRILAVSDQTKEKLVAIKKIKPEKIKAVYCGVDYDTITQISAKYASEKGSKYDAVFMKRLNYGKGVFDLLKIWKAVVAKNPDAKLAIIGDGSEDVIEKIKGFLAENKLEKNVELLGVIYDIERKFRIINSAKVFLLPTHEENWAIVVGEAMAAKVPVVVSRLREIEPIWKDNVVWCKVGDIDAFAAEVHGLVSDLSKANNLANKAYEFVAQYDWKNIAQTELKD